MFQAEKQREIDREFKRYVRADGSNRPMDQWHHFYDKHLEFIRARSFDEGEAIAWFEE